MADPRSLDDDNDDNASVSSDPQLPRCGFLALHVQIRALECGWLASSDPQPEFGQKLSQAEAKHMHRAFGRIASLLEDELRNSSLPCLHICVPPLNPPEGFDPPINMTKALKDVPWILGPPSGLSGFVDKPGFTEWVEYGVLMNDIDTIVIGGCRLSASVRACALELQHTYGQVDSRGRASGLTMPTKLSVVVDLNLCGDEARMYKPICEDCMAEYHEGRLKQCTHTTDENERESPAQHAIDELREAGVLVVEEGETNPLWTNHVFWASPWRDLEGDSHVEATSANQEAATIIPRSHTGRLLEFDQQHVDDCRMFERVWSDLREAELQFHKHEWQPAHTKEAEALLDDVQRESSSRSTSRSNESEESDAS